MYNASAKLASFSKKNHSFKTRTGLLESSIEVDTNGLSSSIFVDSTKVNYAPHVYYGTKDRFVEPRSKQALSWALGGERFFSKGHDVKGYKGDPWIENNFEKRYKNFQETFAGDLAEQIEDYI